MKINENALVLESEITPAGFLVQGELPFMHVHEQGIDIDPEMPEEVWLQAMQHCLTAFEKVQDTHVSMMFRVGDLLLFGESKFGERYSQAIDETRRAIKFHQKTIANAEWICGSIDREVRHLNLTMSHHEAVAKLERGEQIEFLDLAEKEGLSVRALKDQIAIRHPKKPRAVKADKTKKEGIVEEVDAIEGADSFLRYFEQQEEEHGPVSTWPNTKRKIWDATMGDVGRLVRRFAAGSKKAKRAKPAK